MAGLDSHGYGPATLVDACHQLAVGGQRAADRGRRDPRTVESRPHVPETDAVSSRARDELYLRRHVLPYFESTSLARIERRAVQEWISKLSDKGLAPATVRACHRLLSGMLAEAVEARLIGQSPCRGIKLPRVSRTEQRFLNAVEVARLADAMVSTSPRWSTQRPTRARAGESSLASRETA